MVSLKSILGGRSRRQEQHRGDTNRMAHGHLATTPATTTAATSASAHDPSSMVHDSAASTASSTSCSSSSNNDMRLPKPVASLAKMQKRRRTKANVAFAEEVEPSPVSSHAPLATSNLDKQQVNDPQLSRLFSRLAGNKKKGLVKPEMTTTTTTTTTRTIIDTTTTSASSSIIRPSTDSVATLHHHNNHYLQAPSSNDTWYNHHDGHSRWSIDASQANTPALTPSPTHQGFSSASSSASSSKYHHASSLREVTAVMANEEDAASTSDTPNAITSPSKRSQSAGWLSVANTVCRDNSDDAALSTNEGGGEDTEAEDATDDVPTTQPRRLASCPEAPTRNPDEEANSNSGENTPVNVPSSPRINAALEAALDSNVNTANNSVTDFTITADSSVYSIFEPMHAVPTGEYALSHAAEEARRQRRNRNKLHRPMGTAVNALLRKVFRPRKSSGHGNGHNGNRYDSLESYYKPAGVVLGSGTGGSVRLYYRKSDNQQVAVKFFRRDTEQVRRELTLAQTLPAHPHLMQTLGVYRMSKSTRSHALSLPSTELNHAEMSMVEASKSGYRAADVPVLVTEYYPDDLFAVIERSENMTVDERDRLFAQLVYVVAHLHRHGLAHRDLKLENACVDSTGSLRLIDLGSSASARDRIGQVIKSHQIHGSDPYVAPEVLKAANAYELARERKEPVADEHGYDPFAADCWSLGVIYLCLVRRCFHWEKADVDEDAGYRYFINRRQKFLATFTERERAVIEALLVLDPKKRCTPGDLLVRMPWLRAQLTPATEMDARIAAVVRAYTKQNTTDGSMLTVEQVNELKNMFRDAQGNLDLDRFLCRPVHGGGANGDSSQLPVSIDSCVW